MKEGGSDETHEQGRPTRMSFVVSIVFISVLFVILFAFAFHYWQEENYRIALWCGAAAVCAVVIGVAFAIQAYLIEPFEAANTNKPPSAEVMLDQRAWITVPVIATLPPRPIVGQPLQIEVTLKNIGKTPARNVRGNIVADPVQQGGRPNFSYQNDEGFSSGLMQPNAEYFVTLRPTRSGSTGQIAPLNQEVFDVLGSGKTRLFIHGRIDYEDIFGYGHWMTICYFLLTPDFNGFGTCNEHNETDTTPTAPTANTKTDADDELIKTIEHARIALDNFEIIDLAEGKLPRIAFKIINTGKTPATFIEVIYTIGLQKDIPRIPDYPHPITNMGGIVLQAGREINPVVSIEKTDPEIMRRVLADKYRVHFWGKFTYRDAFGVIHHLGFGYTYDRSLGRFMITRVPGYNFED